ncbi:MAG: 3-deoxy-D-manno-octulosonic acid transferase, partial [Burkholderiales bacterium]|nr:3-deoxy-D-manno-octulosonic acid transferase [Burkholderiales bacterium]
GGVRFGRSRARARPPGEVLWIHGVWVGATRAAAPLVERLQREHPDAVLLLTCMTAAGRETGRSLYGGRVVQAWLPYDVPFAVRAFLDRWRPRAGLLMETELWPNLVHACRRRGVPLFLVNARMSPRSAAGYARVAPLARPMLAALSGIAAQTAGDAERLAALGARDVTVTGNLKFDLALPEAMRALGAALRERFGRARRVWLCASTREGEEALLLDALARRALPDDVLLVLVPRHPQRFDEVASLLRARGLAAVRRSVEAPVGAAVRVVLGDSMGEMLAYCAAADVAFVGGSLLPLGGQNLLGGPHTCTRAGAPARAAAAGAARRAAAAAARVAAAASLLADAEARERMRAAALAFHAQHRGATQRLWTWLAPRLAERAARDAAAVSPTAGG